MPPSHQVVASRRVAAEPPRHRAVSCRSWTAASPGHQLAAPTVVEREGGPDERGEGMIALLRRGCRWEGRGCLGGRDSGGEGRDRGVGARGATNGRGTTLGPEERKRM